MKYIFSYLLVVSLTVFNLSAQIVFKKKKEDLEKFKDTRLVVVLMGDSAYNASIMSAIEKYWTFNSGYVFAQDTAIKPYNKPEFSYLYFSKGKGSKIKAKLGSCEDDFNGLLITGGGKFKKKSLPEDLIAGAFCQNHIDTADWNAVLTLAVQTLNNHLNRCIEAEGDKGMSQTYLVQNSPIDGSLLNLPLYVPLQSLELKGKEDAATIWGGEIEEMDEKEIEKAILQKSEVLIFTSSRDEKRCTKMVTSTSGDLVYLTEDGVDKCKLNAKDLKALKTKRDKAD